MKLLKTTDWENTEIVFDSDEKTSKLQKSFCKNWEIAKGVLSVLQSGAKKPLAKLVLSIAIRIGDSVYNNKCEV